MMRNSSSRQQSVVGADQPLPDSPASATGAGENTPSKPRKKLSFKEPEIFSQLKFRKPFVRQKPPPLKLTRALSTDQGSTDDPFKEENDDFEELESQAMRVVRTVGQAFEVCHKLSLNNANNENRDQGDKERDKDHGENHRDIYEDQEEIPNEQSQPPPSPVHKDVSLLGDAEDSVTEQTSIQCLLRSHDIPTTTSSTSPIRQSPSGTVTSDCGNLLVGGELTALKHEIQLLRERLEQQSQQTRAAVAHARLLQDQLAAETAARVEAQTRTHQLLVQNKELLEHIGALVGHLREQERISGGHGNVQSQISGSAGLQQTSTLGDLPSLGQGQRSGEQSSPWELEPPTFSYNSYPMDFLYPGNLGFKDIGIHGNNSPTDQLHFQTQLLERLHNISPYQLQRSPYTTPSPYAAMTPNLLVPPSGRPNNSAQLSPNSMSLRVSPGNNFTSSPVMSHKLDNYVFTMENSNAGAEPQLISSFIKPLPCTQERSPVENNNNINNNSSSNNTNNNNRTITTKLATRQFTQDETPTIVLDAPPPGKRSNSMSKERSTPPKQNSSSVQHPNSNINGSANQNQVQKNLAALMRAPGPPPSRTTSARLPQRNELMNQVQRTTWARHTTK